MDYSVIKPPVKDSVMYSADGATKGRIINFDAKRCGMEGCRSNLISVRWDDGSLTYPCSSMVKQISESEFQICHSPEQMAQSGFNVPEVQWTEKESPFVEEIINIASTKSIFDFEVKEVVLNEDNTFCEAKAFYRWNLNGYIKNVNITIYAFIKDDAIVVMPF